MSFRSPIILIWAVLLANVPCGDAAEMDDEAEAVGVLLQADGQASFETYVDFGNDTMPPLDKFSICVRFRQMHGGQPATIFSYTGGGVFEELNVAIKWPDRQLLVMCCDYHIHRYIDAPLLLFAWQHLCISADIRKDKLVVVLDDTVLEFAAKRGEAGSDPATAEVRGDGQLVLGQNNNPDAEWDLTQAFHGELLDFRIYDVALQLDEMRAYTNCTAGAVASEPLYAFGSNVSHLRLSGESKEVAFPMGEICERSRGMVMLMPEKMKFAEADTLCKLFMGALAVPRSAEENREIFDDFIRFNDQCIQGWAALYWMGLESDANRTDWFYLDDGSRLTYGSWLEGWRGPDEEYPCATGAAVNFPYLWYKADCDTLTCPLCNFTAPPTLRLRGLCKLSKFDRTYTLMDYHNGRPVFEGDFFTRIVWGNGTWRMESRRDSGVEALMVEKRTAGYPLGLAAWDVEGDDCAQRRVDFLLTPCDPEDFTCSDGSCIKMTRRCNQVTDCPDNSDELNCRILLVPAGYSPELPPPSLDKDPLPLVVAFEITSVRQFDLMGFRMQLEVVQSITWRDPRVKFANLRQGDFVNEAKEREKVWLPKVVIQDGARGPTDVIMRAEFLLVDREGPPLPDDDTMAAEDKLYDGTSHSMKMVQQYTVGFMCQFRLQMYPFDTQQCILTYNISNMRDNYEFKKGGVDFTGERRLLEYMLVKEQMISQVKKGPGAVQVFFKFKNQYGYYIGNAVVPSLFMVVICYVTLFFDLHDFQDRIMVSLTSLLVLAALFSQTSQSIPKTAYLKHIDVWYIVLITIDFLIIIILVIIENLRMMEAPSSSSRMFVQVAPASEYKDQKGIGFSRANSRQAGNRCVFWSAMKVNRGSIVFLPVATIVFCLVFFITGFITYNSR